MDAITACTMCLRSYSAAWEMSDLAVNISYKLGMCASLPPSRALHSTAGDAAPCLVATAAGGEPTGGRAACCQAEGLQVAMQLATTRALLGFRIAGLMPALPRSSAAAVAETCARLDLLQRITRHANRMLAVGGASGAHSLLHGPAAVCLRSTAQQPELVIHQLLEIVELAANAQVGMTVRDTSCGRHTLNFPALPALFSALAGRSSQMQSCRYGSSRPVPLPRPCSGSSMRGTRSRGDTQHGCS